jgi:hypothetical protein
MFSTALTTMSASHGVGEEDFAPRWHLIAAMACNDAPERLVRRFSAYLSAPQRPESAK